MRTTGSSAKDGERPGAPSSQKSPGGVPSAKKENQPKAQTPPAAAPAAGPPVGNKVLPSGLQYEVLRVGSGPQVTPGKSVKVQYDGRLAKNGKRFDKGLIPFRLGMKEVIPGWDQGVKGMMVGEKRRLLIPSRLAYGARGAPPAIPPHSDLIFEVELKSIK